MSKPEHEWGVVNVGDHFCEVPHGVFLAIGFAGLGPAERAVVCEVAKAAWGWIRTESGAVSAAETGACDVDFDHLASALGLSRRRLERAERSLIAKRIVTKGPDGLSLNESFEEWISPRTGGRLLQPRWLAHALSARHESQLTD